MSVDDLYRWVTTQLVDLVVISGGEPLLQQESLSPLVRSLAEAGHRVEIETNGTVVPNSDIIDSVDQFNVSPKTSAFAGTAVEWDARINPEALRVFTSSKKSIFKFVVTQESDLDEISQCTKEFDLSPLWVMPEGTTREQVLDRMSWLAEEAVRRSWNLSTRLHILLWGTSVVANMSALSNEQVRWVPRRLWAQPINYTRTRPGHDGRQRRVGHTHERHNATLLVNPTLAVVTRHAASVSRRRASSAAAPR